PRWTPSTSTAGIQNYRLQRGCNGSVPADIGITVGATPWCLDLVHPDGVLTYTVQAVDGIGQPGGVASAGVTYESSPPQVCAAPTNLGDTQPTTTVYGPAFYEMNEGTGSVTADGTGYE